ncbi:glycosyltransferase family 2 protein [Maricaulis sp.]|uniref:glycosyltransferase family 2 protein n=1 Tax=Maricaulis sp. TaxID=1486257 RepID=UPI00260C3218|nr:glycosyltransferase family 2 protein [Maricaulis sp.]
MSAHPSVSVIMPVYNAAKTLYASVLSIQAQTCRSWELILVDDGSTDATLEIAGELAQKDPRIRVISQANAGPAAARNTGIGLARARIVAFLDADDIWHRHRLAVCLQHFGTNPQTGIVFTRVNFIEPQAKAKPATSPHFDVLEAEHLLSENPVCTTSNIVARAVLLERLGGFDARMAYIEDQDLLYRAAAGSPWTVEGIDRPLLDYRIGGPSRSADLVRTATSWHRFMGRVKAMTPELYRPRWRQLSADFHRNQARRALRGSLPGTALGFISRALLRDPLILFRMPRRVGLTIAAALALLLPIPQIKEFVR